MATTTLEVIWQDVNRLVGRWVESTSTGAGATDTIVDSALASTLRSTYTFDGMYTRNAATAHADFGKIRRVSTFAKSTGTITLDRAYDTALGTSAAYQIMSVDPARITRLAQDALRDSRYVEIWPLTEITNGDMDDLTSGAPTSWTYTSAGGGGSRATETGVGNVMHGVRSMKVTSGSTAGGYAQSATLDVVPGNPYYFEGACKADSGATYQLILRDITNGEDLKTLSGTDSAFELLYTTGSFPSTCRQVAVRCAVNTASGAGYFDDIVLLDTLKRSVPLPAWVQSPLDVRRLHYRTGVFTDQDHDPEVLYDWKTLDESGLGRGWRLYHRLPPDMHFWAKIIRPYPTISAYNDTTTMQREWIAWSVIVRLFQERSRHGAAGAAGPYAIDAQRARLEMDRYASLYGDVPQRPIGTM